jgi:hypothetical protein
LPTASQSWQRYAELSGMWLIMAVVMQSPVFLAPVGPSLATSHWIGKSRNAG